MARGTDRLQNDINCVDGDVKPQQNKQIIETESQRRKKMISDDLFHYTYDNITQMSLVIAASNQPPMINLHVYSPDLAHCP